MSRQSNERSHKRPTLEDVAAAADVSRSTASIVLRGSTGASSTARNRVEAAAKALGYRPDVRARHLAASDPKVIGVQFRLDSDFHSRLVQRLYLDANAAGYELLLSGVSPTRTMAESIRTLEDARPAGLILVDPVDYATSSLDPRVTHVAIGHRGPSGIDRVSTSAGAGVTLALDHLASLGHRRICYVSGGAHPVSRRRGSVFQQEIKERGIEGWVLEGEYATLVDGTVAAREILTSTLPTAILAYNDEIAVGVSTELARHGLLVPREISVMGFDDAGWIAAGFGLTSVSQRLDLISEHAIQLFLDASRTPLERRKPIHQKITPELRRRTTTAPARH